MKANKPQVKTVVVTREQWKQYQDIIDVTQSNRDDSGEYGKDGAFDPDVYEQHIAECQIQAEREFAALIGVCELSPTIYYFTTK